eukprot:snap_masked-scaffold_42-processed-gene-1.14-mRNA-1 protein AED:0.45 eAED:0.49 QI:0/-1/0/1/-1/1/1/0/687
MSNKSGNKSLAISEEKFNLDIKPIIINAEFSTISQSPPLSSLSGSWHFISWDEIAQKDNNIGPNEHLVQISQRQKRIKNEGIRSLSIQYKSSSSWEDLDKGVTNWSGKFQNEIQGAQVGVIEEFCLEKVDNYYVMKGKNDFGAFEARVTINKKDRSLFGVKRYVVVSAVKKRRASRRLSTISQTSQKQSSVRSKRSRSMIELAARRKKRGRPKKDYQRRSRSISHIEIFPETPVKTSTQFDTFLTLCDIPRKAQETNPNVDLNLDDNYTGYGVGIYPYKSENEQDKHILGVMYEGQVSEGLWHGKVCISLITRFGLKVVYLGELVDHQLAGLSTISLPTWLAPNAENDDSLNLFPTEPRPTKSRKGENGKITRRKTWKQAPKSELWYSGELNAGQFHGIGRLIETGEQKEGNRVTEYLGEWYEHRRLGQGKLRMMKCKRRKLTRNNSDLTEGESLSTVCTPRTIPSAESSVSLNSQDSGDESVGQKPEPSPTSKDVTSVIRRRETKYDFSEISKEHFENCTELVYYNGDWENDVFSGSGTLEVSKTFSYNGKFKNGEIEGRGSCSYINGKGEVVAQYEGSFKQGLRHGRGWYGFFNDGKVVAEFEARFNQDKFEGVDLGGSFRGGDSGNVLSLVEICGDSPVALGKELNKEGNGENFGYSDAWVLPIRSQGEMKFVHLDAGFNEYGL